ncbi:hypothetical protein JOD82_002042 [Paenibacillus sp. 1182]|uniref:hypothetical protein n=1 Tax=Paenibacillus sp. 1182 TaxID=2806565 RepID=UPI001AE71F9A|nr:hypothetical protein [Paenibacillus sp. 1182]MBP1309022.1 hypothetical protein [Paenibacillus sp. 1182]
MSESQRNAIENIEKNTGIKFEGPKTAQAAFLFLNEHIEKARKPMSKKQRAAIEAIEEILGIKFTGEETAQGAFLFLNKHIETAQKKVWEMIEEERRKSPVVHHPVVSQARFNPMEDFLMDQMALYRFDDSYNGWGDADDDNSYAVTPTVDSLRDDLIFWSRFL